MSGTVHECVHVGEYRPAENVVGRLCEERRPGHVGLVLEDGYLMQRAPPLKNLAAAQGSLPSRDLRSINAANKPLMKWMRESCLLFI